MLLGRLTRAYVRRRSWEAQVQAVAIVRVLGEALGGGKSDEPPEQEWRAADDLMRGMGVRLDGG